MSRVADKVVLVTGAGSGIGRATAKLLAAEGATVIVTDINRPGGLETVQQIGGEGAASRSTTPPKKPTGSASSTTCWRAKAGSNGLVNNAGIAGPYPATFETETLEQWRRMLSINVEGVFLGCKYGVPAMRQSGGGSIVNTSSLAAFLGTPDLSAYGASKGAVRQFTKTVAIDCARKGYKVRCNSVHPGIIMTPMGEGILPNDKARERARRTHPDRRIRRARGHRLWHPVPDFRRIALRHRHRAGDRRRHERDLSERRQAMQHADQVAYLERMLRMVRTNTRDDGPGVSHTPVEEYYDPVRFQREVDLLFRKLSDRRRLLGPAAQAGRLRRPQRHRPADPGDARHRRRAARLPQRLPPSQRHRRAEAVRRQQARLRLRLSRLELRPHRPAGRHHRRRRVRRASTAASTACAASRSRRNTGWSGSCRRRSRTARTPSLDIDAYLGALKADLSGWDMQGWELHSSEPIRPRMNWKLVIDTFLELYHFRYLHPDSVYPLFLDNIATYERMGRHMRMGGGQAHAHRAGGPAQGELAHPRPRHRALPALPQHGADLHPGSLRRVHQLPGLARRIGDAVLGAGAARRRRPRSPTATGRPMSISSPPRWSRISASARPSSAISAAAPTASRPSASSRRRWAGTTKKSRRAVS